MLLSLLVLWLLFTYNEQSYFSTFLCTGVLYTMMIKKKESLQFCWLWDLVPSPCFHSFPVFAAEETAQYRCRRTDSRSVCRSHQRYRRMAPGLDISSAAAIVMGNSTNTVLYSKMQISPLPCKRSQDHDLPGCLENRAARMNR